MSGHSLTHIRDRAREMLAQMRDADPARRPSLVGPFTAERDAMKASLEEGYNLVTDAEDALESLSDQLKHGGGEPKSPSDHTPPSRPSPESSPDDYPEGQGGPGE